MAEDSNANRRITYFEIFCVKNYFSVLFKRKYLLFEFFSQIHFMWRNYLNIALRNLYKRRLYTSINLFGLTVGLSCCALVILFLRHELRYDTFHPRYQDIYRLAYTYNEQGYAVNNFIDWTDDADKQLIKTDALRELPEVEEVAHFNVTYSQTMGKYPSFIKVDRDGGEPTSFTESKILMTNTGKELLDMFGWQFIAGDASQACQNFYSAILTEQTAERYFGKDWKNKSILNRTIHRFKDQYRITGVIENIPEYAHYDFDLILYRPSILSWGAYTYLRLHPDADLEEVTRKVNEVLIRVEPEIADNPSEDGSYLQPLADIHLHSEVMYELKPPGDVRYLYIFAIIGGIILLITCTNYINLSVAMYAGRHQEIGMRKVLGAQKSGIIGQFLTEAVLLAMLCLPLVLGLLFIILPFFNQLMNLKLQHDFLTSLPLLGLLVGTALCTGLLSGLYPAWVLARKQPIRLFKEGITRHGEGLVMRRALIIFQFTLLIALSSATFFINQQLRFIHEKDVGFEKEGIVAFIPFSVDSFNIIKNELQSYPQIKEIGSGYLPGMGTESQMAYQLLGTQELFMDAHVWYMDFAAAKAMGIHSDVLEQIERENKDFKEIFLINEPAARTLSAAGGISQEQLIGRTVMTDLDADSPADNLNKPFVITGFVEDIHLNSLRQAIHPLFVRISKEPDPGQIYQAIVKIDTKNLSETVGLMEDAFHKVIKDWPFEVTFLEEQLGKLYEQEQQVSALTIWLSIVAVVLALLGLVGLTAYLTNLRVKEIGIRKVMGASVGQILLLLNREFFLLIFVATVIAAPIAYYFINVWLSDFAYHVDINVGVFILVGFLAFIVSIMVVTIQSVKAATANPAETLRRE